MAPAGQRRPSVERLERRRLLSARLIGITGNQGSIDRNPANEVLYDISLTDASVTRLLGLPWVPDTDALGYNPETQLLHRTSGSESYSNNPGSNGYRDNQSMQTIDLRTPAMTQAGVFNANSEGNAGGTFGVAAPRPTWVLPVERRTDQQTGQEFRARGVNEYHALRDFTWSSSEHLFYGTDEHGIFKLTADGQSTFVGPPAGLAGGPKGITFFTIDGERRLLVTERDGPNLYTIDPTNGQTITSLPMSFDSNGTQIPGVLSLVEHPDGKTLLGIAKTSASDGGANRQLVRIDPLTGGAQTIGTLSVHIADLAFVATGPTEVFGRRVFYNNSLADGNNAAANAQDDAAIDTRKSGGTSGGPFTASNVTGYSKGLNGVMVDLFALPATTTTLSASDFTIRSTSAAAPNAWAAGPAPLSVSVRRGAGPGGTDRVTLIWNDYSTTSNPPNEAVGQGWLEVTINANANTGLASPVTFVYGNLPADINGDQRVNSDDFILLAQSFGRRGVSPAAGDINGDQFVNTDDFVLLASNFAKTLAPPPAAAAPASVQSTTTVATRTQVAAPARKAKRVARLTDLRARRLSGG